MLLCIHSLVNSKTCGELQLLFVSLHCLVCEVKTKAFSYFLWVV